MKLISIFTLAFLGLSFPEPDGRSQVNDFTYKPIPAHLTANLNNNRKEQDLAVKIAAGAYNLTESLPADYVTDGSVDYTEHLQTGINTHKDVVFPDFPVLVNTNGLTLQSNTAVVFKRNSSVVLKANDRSAYAILKLSAVENITVFFPVIIGDRKMHTGTAGEWGMGISIKGSKNISLISPKVTGCWGDGI